MTRKTLVMLNLYERTISEMKQIAGYDYRFRKPEEVTDDDLAWCEVIVGDPADAQIAKAPHLEWIQTDSAGVNRWKNLNPSITLSNANGYGPGIAEYLCACVFMCDKKLLSYARKHDRCWDNLGYGKGISNLKVLSVGMGSIGTEFLKRMHAMGSECYGIRRTVHDKPDYVTGLYSTAEIDSILPEMDIAALSLPETSETIGYFNAERMHRMKKDSILINVGRGTAIVTNDLIHLLNEGWFSAVILDVTDPEPLPKNNPLWNNPRVLITPHISGRFHNPVNYDHVADIILENLRRSAAGQPLLHVIDHKIGY